MEKIKEGTGPDAPDKLAAAEAKVAMTFTNTVALVKMQDNDRTWTQDNIISSEEESISGNTNHENTSMVEPTFQVVGPFKRPPGPGQEEDDSTYESSNIPFLNLDIEVVITTM